MSKDMKVAIIGFGHVGKAIQIIFPEAIVYDKFIPQYSTHQEQVNGCDLGIVCVPTPECQEDGACDVSAVEEVVSWLDTPLILIKSSIPPGTTEHLKKKYSKRITVSPEYFGESSYWLPETFSPLGWPYLIVGGERPDTAEVIQFFAPRLGPDKVYRQTDSKTAELTKYMENAWLACQVIFAAEFSEAADSFGVDYSELRELWALDPRVSKWHTLVFGGNKGFGGKCLPKDLNAIIAASRASGHDPKFLQAIWDSNVSFRSDQLPADQLPADQLPADQLPGNGRKNVVKIHLGQRS